MYQDTTGQQVSKMALQLQTKFNSILSSGPSLDLISKLMIDAEFVLLTAPKNHQVLLVAGGMHGQAFLFSTEVSWQNH